MDRWSPKHVELTYVMNKTQSLKSFVYFVRLHIYYNIVFRTYVLNAPLYILFPSYEITNFTPTKFTKQWKYKTV